MIEAKDLTLRQAEALRLMSRGWYILKNHAFFGKQGHWLCYDGTATRIHQSTLLSFMRHGWIANDPQSIQPKRYDLTFWGKQIAEGLSGDSGPC